VDRIRDVREGAAYLPSSQTRSGVPSVGGKEDAVVVQSIVPVGAVEPEIGMQLDVTKWPKAAAKITDDQEEFLAFYDFPAEHWGHLRTSNPIESTLSPVRACTNVTRGAGSRASALGMAFKLLQAAEGNWRKVNAPHLVALVAAGATFVNAKLVERSEAPNEGIGKPEDQVAA
jgi:hypothetical protein